MENEKKKKKKLKGKKASQSLSCYKHPTKDMVETQIMQGEPGL
jgi:hypothetical protein